ncbi:hypothetical protein GCM10010193_54120 [Kitasatospora atroaurantiaca]
MGRLFRLWARAEAEHRVGGAAAAESSSAAPESVPTADQQPSRAHGVGREGLRPPSARRRWRTVLIAWAIVLLGATTLTGSSVAGRPQRPGTPQHLTGPMWSQTPTDVPSTLFGVTMNSSSPREAFRPRPR